MPEATILPSVPWPALAIALPLAAALATLLFLRHAQSVALVAAGGCTIVAIGLALQVAGAGSVVAVIGGWEPPLGIALRADGLAALMVLVTAVVAGSVTIYARGRVGEGMPALFWPMLFVLWASLAGLFLSNDLFNIYVALELLTFASVGLVAAAGTHGALTAALRYLMIALLGSLAYLLGVALLYGAYGTLDIGLLAGRAEPGMATDVAASLMTVGLLAKGALFPLHVWLPPAHAAAPPPASALLSGLVVKAPFYLLVRLWFELLPGAGQSFAPDLLGGLGAAAIIWGSWLALRTQTLKAVIAYSTVAQLGYLFLVFPLAGEATASQPWVAGAWTGAVIHALAHASAKAALFLAVGTIVQATGRTGIAAVGGAVRRLPATILAFGLAGLTLMGLPPSGGFVAKWLLLTAAIASGQWWWAVVMLAGGLLAGGYLFRVLSYAFVQDAGPDLHRVAARRQVAPMVLASVSVLLGLVPYDIHELLQVGRPDAAEEGLS